MDFLVDSKNDFKIITLMSGLTRETHNRIEEFLDSCIENGDKNIVIDLSYTKYIDSSGIGSMVEYYKKFKELGGRLALFGANTVVIEIFESLNLPDDLWRFASIDEII